MTPIPAPSTARRLPLIVAATLVLSACHPARAPAAPPSPVLALTVGASRADDTLRYPVDVQPRDSTTLSFRTGGKVIARGPRLGDRVRQGEIVARLDPLDASKQLAIAEAALSAAEHRLGFARQQLDRDQAQAASQLIATTQLEQTRDAYAAALSGRDQAAAQRRLARNALDYTTLRADHDGVITSENADTGAVVAAGQAIYGLAWSGDTDVVLDAAQNDVPRIAVGRSASVTFSALPGARFDARVREIAPAADSASRSYRVKLTLLHPGKDVRLGMSGEATLSAMADGHGDRRVALPVTALFHQGARPAVWVIRPDSTLELRPVTVLGYGERTVTVGSGLASGERIVAAGVHTVFAGQHVTLAAPLFSDGNDASGAAR